jgi:hypothetical protein
MKIIFYAVLAVALLSGAAFAASAAAKTKPLGYADYAKLFNRLAAGETAADIENVIPSLRRSLAAADEVSKRWWTDSTSYDEFAHDQILPDPVMDALGIAHETTNDVEHASAGIMHTYGYLFSQLKTKYGLKSKRWIESRLDERLGLPARTFSPLPPQGEFLANVTSALTHLCGFDADLPGATKAVPHARMLGAVEETVQWRRPDGATVDAIVRTRLVALAPLPGVMSSDTHLLIYDYESAGEHRFVTAFPVESSFAKTILDSKPSTDNAFKPRFNFYVDPDWNLVSSRSSGFIPAKSAAKAP